MNNTIILTEKQDYLKKYNIKKSQVQTFYEFAKEYKSENMKIRIKDCAGLIGFLAEKNGTKKRLAGGNFCNSRFCPVCQWRKSKRDGYTLLFLLNHVQKVENKEIIFLTLTAPNVKAEQLDEEIKDFNKAFKRLSETKSFKAMSKGYIRKLEVTYNAKEDTYHPHFHVVIAVNKSYFTDKNYYINQRTWLEMWKNAKKNPNITQVDVRRAKMDTIQDVMELATYSAKSSDVLYSKDVFDVFYKNLKSKKLIVFNGIFKDILKAYKDGELEEYKELDETIYNQLEWFKHNNEQGYQLWRIDIAEEEKLDKVFIDEIDLE
ncbi:MAG: protein rep, partial [Cetobacterium sp.]